MQQSYILLFLWSSIYIYNGSNILNGLFDHHLPMSVTAGTKEVFLIELVSLNTLNILTFSNEPSLPSLQVEKSYL